MAEWEDFETPVRAAPAPEDDDGRFRVDLDGYEGPIDVLLALAREQKVDLAQISILRLADQYLEFIARARHLRLEVAADYLVMAAWLAYLKSRILLPDPPEDEEALPSGEEMAAMLAFQLQRLEAMRKVGSRLMARPQLGQDVFARGDPEPIGLLSRPVYDVSLYELLRAYGERQARAQSAVLEIRPASLESVEDAIERLSAFLGRMPTWTTLESLLPPGLRAGVHTRSSLAATFVATLELARQGRVRIRQDEAFGPIYLRGAGPEDGDVPPGDGRSEEDRG